MTKHKQEYPDRVRGAHLRDTINGFLSLQENWNGYEADTFSRQTIDRALLFLKYISENDAEVFPTGRGTVQFEWGNGLEIEIGADSEEVLLVEEE